MLFQIDKSKLYQKLFESFKKSHTSTKVQNVQKLVNEVWRNYKLQAKSDKELDIIVSKRIEEELQTATKNNSNLLHFFPSAADDKRRTESIRKVKTLDECTQELRKIGFDISRSGTYLRLIPRKSNSAEGRRHVSTVPVKLIRAQTNHHKSHLDSKFVETSIHYLENIASILGPDQVFFISQDDKARVPIGVTAANKQAPLLMHMEFRIKLPDNDWVIAVRHKLIPSVYASTMLGQPEAVGYSGPTYIAIRSGKHTSSTANTHTQDFDTLLELEEFRPSAKTDHGLVKPVRHDLDALFLATNAPGSAYNRVARRMAPLSRELAGLILPHDIHLDERGVINDEHLERSNFEFAGNVLAEVWSSMEIDGYNVTAKYVGAGEQDLSDFPVIKWYSESQYLLQIVKCRNTECCRPRSGLFRLLDNRFLPPTNS
ncbi:unnamed protein product [Psylliodes chrysocephalus]|uniref:Uncharacterized protein n=1 Tax=Psylliodes chrysocephalus TaxID=3402493 RepID=A0A9P0CWM9_9CUCU|nr:unnamed protein product [Psylliodes chrysocephala]